MSLMRPWVFERSVENSLTKDAFRRKARFARRWLALARQGRRFRRAAHFHASLNPVGHLAQMLRLVCVDGVAGRGGGSVARRIGRLGQAKGFELAANCVRRWVLLRQGVGADDLVQLDGLQFEEFVGERLDPLRAASDAPIPPATWRSRHARP